MLVQNDVVTFRFVLGKTATVYAEDYFDLQIQFPDGSVTYQEGVTGAGGWQTDATYLAPDANTEGNLETDLTLSQLGVYTLLIGNGGPASFTILDTVLALVVEADAVVLNQINLP
jgi:hypothetical protein